jgi:hypothetical protein
VRRPSLLALSGEQKKEPEAAAKPRAPRCGPDSTSPARRSSSPGGAASSSPVRLPLRRAMQSRSTEASSTGQKLRWWTPSAAPPPPPLRRLCCSRSSNGIRRRGIRRPSGESGAAAGNPAPDLRAPCSGRRAMVAVVVPSYLRGASSGDPLLLCFSPALPLLRGGWGRRAGCVGPCIPFIPHRALFGARAAERDRSVGFAVPRCGQKNCK